MEYDDYYDYDFDPDMAEVSPHEMHHNRVLKYFNMI